MRLRHCLLLAFPVVWAASRSFAAQTYALPVGSQADAATITAVESAPDGSVYVAGTFRGVGSITGLENSHASNEVRETAYVGRISPEGGWLWSREYLGGQVRIDALAPTSNGVYVAVTASGALSQVTGGSPSNLLTQQGRFGLVHLLTAQGEARHEQLRIVPESGTDAVESISSMAIRPGGNLVIGGNYRDHARFAPGTALAPVYPGTVDMFVAEATAGFQWAWATNAGGPDADHLAAVKLDPAGSVLVAGTTSGRSSGRSDLNFFALTPFTLTAAESSDVAVMVDLQYDDADEDYFFGSNNRTPRPGRPPPGTRIARTVLHDSINGQIQGFPSRFGSLHVRTGLDLNAVLGETTRLPNAATRGFFRIIDEFDEGEFKGVDYLEFSDALKGIYPGNGPTSIQTIFPLAGTVHQLFPELVNPDGSLTRLFFQDIGATDLAFRIWGARYLGGPSFFVARLDVTDSSPQWTEVRANPIGDGASASAALGLELVDNQIVVVGRMQGYLGTLVTNKLVVSNGGEWLTDSLPANEDLADPGDALAIRFRSDFTWDRAVVLRSPGRLDSFQAVRANDVNDLYLLGTFGDQAKFEPLPPNSSPLTASRPNLLLTRLNPDFQVASAARIGTNRIPEKVAAGGLALMPGADRLLFGGLYEEGTFEPYRRSEPLPEANNTTGAKAFLGSFDILGQVLSEEVTLEIVSEFARDYVVPRAGSQRLISRTRKSVSAPARAYQVRGPDDAHFLLPLETHEESLETAVKGLLDGSSRYFRDDLRGALTNLLAGTGVALEDRMLVGLDFRTASPDEHRRMDALIRDHLVPWMESRFINLGFGLNDEVAAGLGNRIDLTMSRNLRLKFNWLVEHALDVVSEDKDTPEPGLAPLQQETFNALGSPQPRVQRHWIPQGEEVAASVDGVVISPEAPDGGTRFALVAYAGKGAAPSAAGGAFRVVNGRVQIGTSGQFRMTEPSQIAWQWKRQHRVQISTTSSETEFLPRIATNTATDGPVKLTPAYAGSGEFWFFHGTHLWMGAPEKDADTGKSLSGWLNAFGGDGRGTPYFPHPIFPATTADSGLYQYLTPIPLSDPAPGNTFLLREIPALLSSCRITWNFGDTVEDRKVAIGQGLARSAIPNTTGIEPPQVTIVDGPPGSTAEQMHAWDAVRQTSLPLRPGICLLEWRTASGGKAISQVVSGFPGATVPNYDGRQDPNEEFPLRDRSAGSPERYRAWDYAHVAGTPPVDLDPSSTTNRAFLGLAYSTGDARLRDGRGFEADQPGKSVLLFSTNSAGVAVGDRTREPLEVSVVETRRWDGVDWSVDPAGSGDPRAHPLLNQTNSVAPIGRPLSSPNYQNANVVPGRGFVLFEDEDQRALYNRDIYRAEPAPASIFPVNQWQGLPDDLPLDQDRDLVVVWYEQWDGIQWPFQPERFKNFTWPAKGSGDRIVIASRLGSEGVNVGGEEQLIFAQDRYDQVSIYNQPDRRRPGYNPNEEHALIAPSFRFRNVPNPPPAAFALRNDLNITGPLIAAISASFKPVYTSDPFVLVQYYDRETRAWGMRSYEVQREDPSVGSSLGGRSAQSPAGVRSTLSVTNLAGSLQDLNVIVDLEVPPGEDFEISLVGPGGEPDRRAVLAGISVGRGVPLRLARVRFDDEAASALDLRANGGGGEPTPVVHTGDFRSDTGGLSAFAANGSPGPNGEWTLQVARADGSTAPSGAVIRGFALEWMLNRDGVLVRQVVTAEALSDVAFPYVFRYDMKAGEPIVPPYPLDRVIGAEPCLNPVNADGVPLSPPTGTSYQDGVTRQRTHWFDHRGFGWAISGDSYFYGQFFYPLRTDFWYPSGSDGALAEADVGDCIPFLPEWDLESDSKKLGVFDGDKDVRQTPGNVQFNTQWPDDLPVMKVGETLTFAGGEYRQDFPAAPGLPGVVGWSAGEIVYDSQNPTMTNDFAFATNAPAHTGRLASPLLEHRVRLRATEFPEDLRPASRRTRVRGAEYAFEDLSASLQRRVFYDFVTGELGIRGLLADRKLGDPDLTAAPPPNAILEPNILTAGERDALRALAPETGPWTLAVDALYQKSRNPAQLELPWMTPDAYLVGVGADVKRDAGGRPIRSPGGDPEYDRTKPVQPEYFGPGLALFPNHAAFDPRFPWRARIYDYVQKRSRGVGYLVLAENDHPDLGAAPVRLHLIRVDPERRYRGFVKTVASDNAFDEKITLRHSGDFGARAEDLVFQWWIREEDGTESLLPGEESPDPWQLFGRGGPGKFQVDLAGVGPVILRDNRVFVRYRHQNETTASGVDWSGSDWRRFGAEWAGAVNSPDASGQFRPALVPGWVKRVLDSINPYEARVAEITGSADSPATYASMIQQLGERYEGPVALNPDQDVIENAGLIGLYQTVLDRATQLSIGLSQPVNTPGVLSALQLAATRLSDFYMLLGNEAYADAQDPTIGVGSAAVPAGALSPVSFAFQNQLPGLLEEELALLRGVDDTFGRPVYNRLLWNFTKSAGEAAYTVSYDIQDVNNDGFLNELDAQRMFPQGHGDAWGHYLTAVRIQYDLLRHPYFNWQSRSEFYNLNDVVFAVDFLDERRFAEAAAAKARTGAEIVNLTYRSHYVEDLDGQWQGYRDGDPDRAWGVTEWARRAGQGALFDWLAANAMLPSRDAEHSGIARLDRTTVTDIAEISSQLGAIQAQYDQANQGLNPLGLSRDAVPFDIDPTFNTVASQLQGAVHFDQIHQRALGALRNASTVFGVADANHQNLRRVAQSVESLRRDSVEQDLDFRRRLIAIFGTPYEGTIGPGRLYPPGYQGPDLMTFQYVEAAEASVATIPATSEWFTGEFNKFTSYLSTAGGEFREILAAYFINDLGKDDQGRDIKETFIDPEPFSAGTLKVRLPVARDTYAFTRPDEWGLRRSPGELQVLISDMVQAEAMTAFALSNYEGYVLEIMDRMAMIRLQHQTSSKIIGVLNDLDRDLRTREGVLIALEASINALDAMMQGVTEQAEALSEANPTVVGMDNDPTAPARGAIKFSAATFNTVLRLGQAVSQKLSKDTLERSLEWLQREAQLETETETRRYELAQQLQALEQALRNEVTARIEIFRLIEALRQAGDRYRAKLAEGFRLIEERRNFNRKVASLTQQNRVHDFTFRITRNQALSQYRASFDLAARYAFLAAKAYDFETNLSPEDRGSARPLMEAIIRARALGVVAEGQPVVGLGGLADALGRLRDNFAVLKPRLGINNPQFETGGFSLRREMLRVRKSDGALLPQSDGGTYSDGDLGRVGDDRWRDQLARWRVSDLWAVPEYRRLCRPLAAREAGVPEPGLVIPFATEIRAGRNLFGWPLGPGDQAFDPTVFATKVQAAGVWFEGYDTARLAGTPRVYLIPAGMDVMTVPNRLDLQTREWTIVDQSIPVPFASSVQDLANPNWIPLTDSLSGPLAEIRRYSSFRAYPYSGGNDADELAYNTRLIGRSVWNSQWLLIVPARTMLGDPEAALDAFIGSADEPGVRDIRLVFQTYGYSGN